MALVGMKVMDSILKIFGTNLLDLYLAYRDPTPPTNVPEGQRLRVDFENCGVGTL